MPVYKDNTQNTWYCCFYYIDWQGKKRRKMKRGFARQKDAKDFERHFLLQQQANPDMTMQGLVELYLDDMSNRLRRSTMSNKRHLIDTKVLPYFKNTPIANITPAHIRKWQNVLMKQGFADTYLKSINNQLCAILNYGVKYYGLKENPCHKAGSIGAKHAKDMQFWTKDEYETFIQALEDNALAHSAFQILYWCGVRCGELLALTREDINLDAKTLSINKSYQRIDGEDIITEPKTPKSNRVIAIPDFLCEELNTYLSKLYDRSGRIFPVTKYYLHHEMTKACKKAGLKKIRVHDLRHSHASLLIELGFSPLLIAERLGHENIETTLNTYSHLYPNKQAELAETLNRIFL